LENAVSPRASLRPTGCSQVVPEDAEPERMHNLLADEVGGATLRQLSGKLGW
jgi:hypothetical protein